MAQIRLYGTAKKMEKREIKEAALFFSDHLMGRLSKNILVKVRLRKNFYKKTKCFGMATWTDIDVKNHNHREFEVEIEADLGPIYMLRTLAHELVHVKQYARKELVDMCSGNYQMWNRVMYNENLVGYKNLPWEKEASGREKELYRLWREHQSKL